MVVAAATGAFGSAAYFLLGGDPCKSSSRVGYLFLAPVLFGVTGVILVTLFTARLWRGIAAGVVISLLAGGLLFLLAIAQWGASCYT
ncbi:MAG: hypothetical protein ACKVUT_01875 [Gaiella sp.]